MKYFIVVFDSSGHLLECSPFFQYFGLSDAGDCLCSYLLDTVGAYEAYAYLSKGPFGAELLLHFYLSEIVGYEK